MAGGRRSGRWVAAALSATLLALAAGCGGSDEDAAGTGSAPAATAGPASDTAPAAEPPPRALPGIPADLAGYEGWTRLNAAPIPPREPDPHSGTKNVYASVPPGPDGVFPDGAVVVKDANRPGRDHIGLVAVMRKVAGVDSAHGDWRFVEYARDSGEAPFTVLAQDAVCWGCHSGAAGADWVWTLELGLDR